MIKNIVFDMGNVLIRFDTDVFIDRIGITDPADREILSSLSGRKSASSLMIPRGTLKPRRSAE